MAGAFLVHLTTAMVVVPAAILAYVAALSDRRVPGHRLPLSRHVGVWVMPVLVLAVNAFWWWPGICLAATKGASDFAFAHPEPVTRRLAQIFLVEAPIQSVLLGLGILGLVVVARRSRVAVAGLLGFLGAGFVWGYLAGASRTLDFLQPGRHTYAFFTGLALAGGVGLARVMARLRDAQAPGGRLDRWATLALAVVSVRFLGLPLYGSLEARLGDWRIPFYDEGPRAGREPFLASRPSPRLLWVVDRVKRHVRPGERLLYEEGGFGLPGIPDPFQGGRFSGLLPHLTGIEVLGGPYLHAALTTNFTQFGEGKLFGKADWDRDHFVKYARLYRPAAIVCWSPHARSFCAANPHLIDVKDDDGVVVIGRVLGFEGATIEGSATVEAAPGRLRVRDARAGLDGTVVLRYHSVPCLRSNPPVASDSVFLEGDPVPFIRLRPPPGTVTFELGFSRGWGALPGH
jgi:hypothetical protein